MCILARTQYQKSDSIHNLLMILNQPPTLFPETCPVLQVLVQYFLPGFHTVHPVVSFITARSSGQFLHLLPLSYHTAIGQQLLFNFVHVKKIPQKLPHKEKFLCFKCLCRDYFVATLAISMQLNRGEAGNSVKEQYSAMPEMQEVQTCRSQRTWLKAWVINQYRV